MIDLAGVAANVQVPPAEYNRLLGYPRSAELSERAAELTEWARGWYAQQGHPWVSARQAEIGEVRSFSSRRLRKMLADAEADGAVLAAVTAGPELEAEAQRLWREEKPDEYFFLEVYGSAVVEHLITMTGARLCAWAEEQGMAVLPHDSPGYAGWEISEQPGLHGLLRPVPIEVLESGALRPKKSLLAVFGLTRHTEHLQRLTELVPCANCSFTPCQYRRAPYGPPDRAYTVNAKALKRWASERLSIERHADGALDALFLYEGTTCTNMGRPLKFLYRVKLGPKDEGYLIREQSCGPAPGDRGYESMCAYLDHGPQLMTSIDGEKPLLGRRLEDVLGWQRAQAPAGCYCDRESRQHKWGLVLETIHYALTQQR